MNVAKSCFRICATSLAATVASSIEEVKLGSVGGRGRGRGAQISLSESVSKYKSMVYM